MKSKVLFFGLLLSFLMSLEIHATDYQVDKFNLNTHAGRIAGYLWRGEKVPDQEIEKIFNSVVKTARNSDASVDSIDSISKNPVAITNGRDTVETETISLEISALINDFLEVTEEIAKERSKKREADPTSLQNSLQLFVTQINQEQRDPYTLRTVLDAIAEAYC